MIRRHTIIALLGGMLLLLAACGGGAGGTTAEPQPVAGGGIGGTGSGPIKSASIAGTGQGTITGYEGVVINDDRQFDLLPQTLIQLDGHLIRAEELQAQGTGFVARLLLGDDVDPSVTSGTALSVKVDHYLAGPVTSVSPELEVLGQPVVTDGSTQSLSSSDLTSAGGTALVGLKDASDLKLDEIVRVSGYPGLDNHVLATRLERMTGGTAVWKLTGPVSQLQPGVSFSIGAQRVEMSGVIPSGCGDGLQEGNIVVVEATADPYFAAGDPLTTVVRIACIATGLEVPLGMVEPLAAVIEGLVGTVAMPVFTVDGQQVVTTPATVYKLGGPADIVSGAKVEAQGKLDSQTGILVADQIRFRGLDVHIRGPVYPENIDPGKHLEIIGIRVYGLPDTRDAKGILSVGLVQPEQVDVAGYLDVDGRVYAKSIKSGGPLDATRVELRGPVERIDGPSQFSILGIKIDTTNTRRFVDPEGNALSRQAFFDALQVDASVEVSGASVASKDSISDASQITLLTWTDALLAQTGGQGDNQQ